MEAIFKEAAKVNTGKVANYIPQFSRYQNKERQGGRLHPAIVQVPKVKNGKVAIANYIPQF